MLKKITLNKSGFNTKVNVEDTFQFQGSDWVIIRITEIKPSFMWGRNQELKIEVVAQKEGTYNDYSHLETSGLTFGKHRLDKDDKPNKVGDVVRITGSETFIEITSIEDIQYEFIDLVVTYGYAIVEEYPLDVLNKLLKKERMKKFKVI